MRHSHNLGRRSKGSAQKILPSRTAAGRAQDLADVAELRESREQSEIDLTNDSEKGIDDDFEP